MIDITSVQPFNIPPEIEVLQNENTTLIQQNEELTLQTKVIAVGFLTLIIVGIYTVFSLKSKRDEKEKILS